MFFHPAVFLPALAGPTETPVGPRKERLLRSAEFLEALEREINNDDASHPVEVACLRAELAVLSIIVTLLSGIVIVELQSLPIFVV